MRGSSCGSAASADLAPGLRFTPRSKHFGQDKARKAQDALDAWNAAHQMWTHPITKVKYLIDKSDIHKSEL